MSLVGQHRPVDSLPIGNIGDAIVDNIPTLIDGKLPDEAIHFVPAQVVEVFSYEPFEPEGTFLDGICHYSASLGWWPTIVDQWSCANEEQYLYELAKSFNKLYDDLPMKLLDYSGRVRKLKPKRTWTFNRDNDSSWLTLLAPNAFESGTLSLSKRTAMTALAVINVCNVFDTHDTRLAKLAQNMLNLFESQPDRRFGLGASLLQDDMFFAVFHRGGLLISTSFNIHEDPEKFLRIVVGLAFLKREHLGFSPDIVYTCVDEIPGGDAAEDRQLTVDGSKYTINSLIHSEATIRGRATTCYKVRDQAGRFFVVKVSWPSDLRRRHEPDVLIHLHKAKNIVTMRKFHTPSIKSLRNAVEEDTTLLHQEELLNEFVNLENWEADLWCTSWLNARKQLRIVLEPVGIPFSDFRSQREVVSAIIDVLDSVDCMRQRGCVHRDIRGANILFREDEGEFPRRAERRAFVIDFDRAKMPDLQYEYDWMSGNVLYSSIELLQSSDPIKHEYYHDFESIFYFLLITCCTYDEPRGSTRKDFDVFTDPYSAIRGWHEENAMSCRILAGKMKRLDVGYSNVFKQEILELVTPYFGGLKECLTDLRTLVCGWYGPMAEQLRISANAVLIVPPNRRDPVEYYKAFRAILERAYDALPATPIVEDDEPLLGLGYNLPQPEPEAGLRPCRNITNNAVTGRLLSEGTSKSDGSRAKENGGSENDALPKSSTRACKGNRA